MRFLIILAHTQPRMEYPVLLPELIVYLIMLFLVRCSDRCTNEFLFLKLAAFLNAPGRLKCFRQAGKCKRGRQRGLLRLGLEKLCTRGSASAAI